MANSTDSETKATGWTLNAPAAATLVRCVRHTAVDATLRCELCQASWCKLCVAMGDERGVVWRRCECGGRCETIAVEPAPPTAQEFGAELLDALRYPWGGAARLQIAFGACMFGVMTWLSGSSLLLAPLITGYLFAYVELVIAWTVKGHDDPPGFPDFVTIGESMFAPLRRLLVLLLVSFGPGLLLWKLVPGIGAFVGFVALLAGLAWFPMALLAVTTLDSIDGYDPRRVVASIRLVPGPYAFAATLFGLVFALILGSGFAPIDLPFVGSFLRGALIFALATIAGRVLGLTYRRFAKQLAWV